MHIRFGKLLLLLRCGMQFGWSKNLVATQAGREEATAALVGRAADGSARNRAGKAGVGDDRETDAFRQIGEEFTQLVVDDQVVINVVRTDCFIVFWFIAVFVGEMSAVRRIGENMSITWFRDRKV